MKLDFSAAAAITALFLAACTSSSPLDPDTVRRVSDVKSVARKELSGPVLKPSSGYASPSPVQQVETVSFYISGQVRLAGAHSLQKGAHLSDAIVKAGGCVATQTGEFVNYPDERRVRVTRVGGATKYDMREIKAGKQADPVLNDGDQIYVPAIWL